MEPEYTHEELFGEDSGSDSDLAEPPTPDAPSESDEDVEMESEEEKEPTQPKKVNRGRKKKWERFKSKAMQRLYARHLKDVLNKGW